MLYIADNSDVLRHFNQVRDAGLVPPQLVLKGVKFEAGGGIFVDGAIDLPFPLGGFSLDLKLVVKLLPDKKTIRIRIVNIAALDIGVRGLAMKVIDRIADSFAVPGLRTVRDGADLYWEYTPMAWVLLQDILTQDDRLTIVADGVDIPLLIEETRKAQLAALESSGSMADQVKIAQVKSASAAREKHETPRAVAVPDLGDGKTTMRIPI
jgi:hypothetical protein